jgi:hypothetical protein
MISANCDNVPSPEEWERRLRSVSDEELHRLWQHALDCLAQDILSQKWAQHVGIAERLLTGRGVEYR